jgi:hypothetical protein
MGSSYTTKEWTPDAYEWNMIDKLSAYLIIAL